MRIVMIADLHACRPWMSAARVERIVAQANALDGDMIVLLGDYVGHIPLSPALRPAEVAGLLASLKAPMGVWAVQGNHDWYDDPAAAADGRPTIWHAALEDQGIAVLENRNVQLDHNGVTFALAGLGSQRGLAKLSTAKRAGVDDITAALAGTEGMPTILLAHEPDVFPDLPDHVALTLSGHTHGGQIKLFGRTPVVPSRYGSRYAYGHMVEGARHLVVSGGLGCTTVPLRIGVPPEITVVEVS